MRRSIPLFLALSLLLPLLVSSASAFDGRRAGFVIGGGFGPGIQFAKQEVRGPGLDGESDWENDIALVTDFLIGGGVTDQVLIYYSSRVSWFKPGTADLTLANGVGSIAANIYVRPQAPSPYFTAGLGFAALDAPFEEGVDGSYGLGLRVGAGLEFTTHWSLELGLTYGTPSEDVKDLEFTSNMLSVHMVVVGKAY